MGQSASWATASAPAEPVVSVPTSLDILLAPKDVLIAICKFHAALRATNIDDLAAQLCATGNAADASPESGPTTGHHAGRHTSMQVCNALYSAEE